MNPVCFYCDEPVLPGEESGVVANAASHRECAFRSVAGSLAHVERRCSCFVPGSEEGDPPGLTLREGARAAYHAFARVQRHQDLHARRN